MPAALIAAAALLPALAASGANVCHARSASFPDDGDAPDCKAACSLPAAVFGGSAYHMSPTAQPDSASLAQWRSNMAKAGTIMKRHGRVLGIESGPELHVALQYVCCQSAHDSKIISQLYEATTWPSLNISFDRAVCRVDYDDSPAGLYTSIIVLLDEASNARMESLVAGFERRIEAAGVNLTVHRRQQQPFHSTLGAAHTNVSGFDIQAALKDINGQIPPGHWHSGPIQIQKVKFSVSSASSSSTTTTALKTDDEVVIEPFSFRVRGTGGSPTVVTSLGGPGFQFIMADIKLSAAEDQWSNWTDFTEADAKAAAASASNTRQPASLGRLILSLRVVWGGQHSAFATGLSW